MSIIKIDDYTWHYCRLGSSKLMPYYKIIKCGSYFTISPAIFYAWQSICANPFHEQHFKSVKLCKKAIDTYLDKLGRKRHKYCMVCHTTICEHLGNLPIDYVSFEEARRQFIQEIIKNNQIEKPKQTLLQKIKRFLGVKK